MNDPNKPEDRLYLLPSGEKVRIESREGDTVTVRRVDGPRHKTLAVCRIDKLRPVRATN
jgi:hypothetical protein